MNWFENCAVVIPCLNEEAHIGSLVQQVRSFNKTVIVVDDASTDLTALAAEANGAKIISIPISGGKGNAIQAGLNQAALSGFEWCLMMDGDGQHEAAAIPDFFRAAEQTSCQLLIGNRMNQPGNMPFVRRQTNRWMSRRLSQATGKTLPDTQCGFRLILLKAWSKLDLQCAHFEIESEMLIAAIQAGFQIGFVPIRAIYNGEKSKIHPVKDTVRWFKWWLRLQSQPSGRSLRGRPFLAEDAI